MKQLFLVLISFLLCRCMPKRLVFTLLFIPAYAQYNSDFDQYQLDIRRLDSGQAVVADTLLIKSGTYTIEFERSSETGNGYISPYTGAIFDQEIIPNVPGLWQGGTASFSKEITAGTGIYEMTILEHSPSYGNGPKSQPVIFEIMADQPVKIILRFGG